MKTKPIRWICQCGAIHWYHPSQCQRCGVKFSMPKPEKPADDLKLDIDLFKLEDEWRMQPKMYFIWAEKVAEAQAEYDRAKSQLELTRAELDQQIRLKPDEFIESDGKLTEKMIESCIITQQDYKSAIRDVIEAKNVLDHRKAAVDALEHKKRSLQMLVELWIRNYYSEPKVTPHTEEAKEWNEGRVRTEGSRRRKQRSMEERDDD